MMDIAEAIIGGKTTLNEADPMHTIAELLPEEEEISLLR
jgi:hypothetical protein